MSYCDCIVLFCIVLSCIVLSWLRLLMRWFYTLLSMAVQVDQRRVTMCVILLTKAPNKTEGTAAALLSQPRRLQIRRNRKSNLDHFRQRRTRYEDQPSRLQLHRKRLPLPPSDARRQKRPYAETPSGRRNLTSGCPADL